MIRVWLVDDDPTIGGELAAALGSPRDDVQLTSCFENARDALKELERGSFFDVALVDLGLPGMTGEALIRAFRKQRPLAPVVAFTVRADDMAVFGALRAGAVGYLTKKVSLQNLLGAIRAAAAGAAPLDAEISRQVVSSFWRLSGARDDNNPELTAREHEVMELFCTGASYREVGSLLGITEGTVQSHVKSIYAKLGVTSKAEAVRMALQLQLIVQ